MEVFLFDIRLIRLIAITVYKVWILNKDNLHVFSKILIWKKILCFKYQVSLSINWDNLLSKYCNGQKGDEDTL